VRLVPRHWSNETWICSIRGHVTPAATVAQVRPEDSALAIDVPGPARVSRCLRCDAWLRGPIPTETEATSAFLPPLDELDLPRRGKSLEDAIVLRLIALERGVHAVLFTTLAVALLVVRLDFARITSWARSLRTDLNGAIDNTGSSGHSRLARELATVAHLQRHVVDLLLVTAVVYAVVESIEAVGLWRERRWAEYLTVVATAGFLPFEIRELLDRVTVLRVGALVVNLAILVYLVWAKHLFGLRGGRRTLERSVDWDEVLRDPIASPRP
jgi:uncharacterized membrane protein (DUF2068 family)